MSKKVSKSYHKNVNAKDIRIWRKWQKRTKVFALVGLLIALGAGGYYAYKSFAATASFAYTVSNNTLTAAGGGSYVTAGSTGKGKSGESVLAMPRGASAMVSSAQNGEIYIPAGQKFSYCVTESGLDLGAGDARTINSMDVVEPSADPNNPGLVNYIGGWFGGPNSGLQTNIASTTVLSNSYVKYCNKPVSRNYAVKGPFYLRFNHATINYSLPPDRAVTMDPVEPKLVYVSSFNIELVN